MPTIEVEASYLEWLKGHPIFRNSIALFKTFGFSYTYPCPPTSPRTHTPVTAPTRPYWKVHCQSTRLNIIQDFLFGMVKRLSGVLK